MTTYLYALHVEPGFLKVGVSYNPRIRAAAIRSRASYSTAPPAGSFHKTARLLYCRPVVKSGLDPCGMRDERSLHVLLGRFCAGGEWFRDTPQSRKIILRHGLEDLADGRRRRSSKWPALTVAQREALARPAYSFVDARKCRCGDCVTCCFRNDNLRRAGERQKKHALIASTEAA